MAMDKHNPEDVLPLTPAVFHILLALAENERHGYSIMQEIAAQTGGQLRIGPTTLYRSIKRMLEDGLIVEVDERPDPELDDERRRYYRLTTFGHPGYFVPVHVRQGGIIVDTVIDNQIFRQSAGQRSGVRNHEPRNRSRQPQLPHRLSYQELQ